MGHVKFINNTGQPLHIKMEREGAPQVLNYKSKDLASCYLPMWFDHKIGKVTKAVITITAEEAQNEK